MREYVNTRDKQTDSRERMRKHENMLERVFNPFYLYTHLKTIDDSTNYYYYYYYCCCRCCTHCEFFSPALTDEFYESLSDSKSLLISRTLPSILADFNTAWVQIVTIPLLMSSSPVFFPGFWWPCQEHYYYYYYYFTSGKFSHQH